jgi:hypothetical protein
LLDAFNEFAFSQNASRLFAGVNTVRARAYRQMRARGFRIDFMGLTMTKPNEAGYNCPEVYLIDDWR